ncbi:polyphenol oxidase I, chloroplastic-like [Olea europaea var. sylvestris]|uniref:polyphenol oxidase I, chloroplastic-like n=1 Tax=Olea europaea var. sylvestris TaxID=158386 RepID=UPI000C1D4E30|nr:polyphenol oxidase I, chloroplastic-like [Olea europaea var. sylvestris]
MASLQASCILFAKPSKLFTYHSFQVSCNAKKASSQDVETSQGRIDRRNVLIGLGGLYGASNLVSNPLAYADTVKSESEKCTDPVKPDFKNCGTAYAENDPLNINCCPPDSDNIIDYELPRPPQRLRVRQPAHMVGKEYIAKYEEAVRLMKELDKTNPNDPRGFMQQANVHCAYCNGPHEQVGHKGLDFQVHESWLFFPFHRWYLYFYERILGSLIGDPDFALPYWNWDHPAGMTMPPIFDNPRSPLYDAVRDPNNRGSAVVNLNYTSSEPTNDLTLVANNLRTMNSEMITSVNNTLQFMGAPYCDGSNPRPGMGTSERGSHTAIHIWVGTKDKTEEHKYNEDLGNFYSAGRDPLFYCHHGNVDRMWTIWRELDTPVRKDITSPNYLNAQFLFYDENARLVRVKVADCVDQEKMGYTYQYMPIPWLCYRPPKEEAEAKARIMKISDIPNVAAVLPITLKNTVRVLVPKSAKGKVSEQLVIEDIERDTTKFIKFDVFVNDEDEDFEALDRAEYAGTFAQVPHRTKNEKSKSSISLDLTQLYDNIDVTDDDTIVVTIVPRSNGEDITIGGIKIVPASSESNDDY